MSMPSNEEEEEMQVSRRVGKHYCTWGEDHHCYTRGKPRCCFGNWDNCPKRRPACNRRRVKPRDESYSLIGLNTSSPVLHVLAFIGLIATIWKAFSFFNYKRESQYL